MNGSVGLTANGFIAVVGTTWALGYGLIAYRWPSRHRRQHPVGIAPSASCVRFAVGSPPTAADASRQRKDCANSASDVGE